MKVDRYTKVVLTVIALALSALAFKDIVAPQPTPTTVGRYQVFPAAVSVVIDTRSGTLYRASGIFDNDNITRVSVLDTRTGYPVQ